MTDEASLPAVTDDEWLARFVLYSKWIRADQTLRPDAFIPHPYPDLSVTRHLGLLEPELWQIGQVVADARPAELHGRADVKAHVVITQLLRIVPTATPKNHANITGWSLDKPAQKIVAQEIAAVAEYKPNPSACGE